MLPSLQFVTRFAILAVVLSAYSWAQFSGSIQGTVQDPAGAVVPNAKVQLKNTATSVAATTTSDAEGNYRFVSLAPGTYHLQIGMYDEHSGVRVHLKDANNAPLADNAVTLGNAIVIQP